MKRKTQSRILWLLVVLLVLSCGSTMAYMFRQTQKLENNFTPAEVSCQVAEAFDGNQKTSITVKNTGNIPAYLRVRLVTYWVNDEGDIMPVASPQLTIQTTNGWISGADNTYYYPTPIEPETTTPELLAAPIALQTNEAGHHQVIEVFAEAIQSEPENAVKSWPVTVSNGTIIAES